MTNDVSESIKKSQQEKKEAFMKSTKQIMKPMWLTEHLLFWSLLIKKHVTISSVQHFRKSFEAYLNVPAFQEELGLI